MKKLTKIGVLKMKTIKLELGLAVVCLAAFIAYFLYVFSF